MSDASWSRRPWIPVVLILAVSWLLCLAIAVTEPVDRDEHMYLAAAHFVGEARLYEDVAFFQPPYAAWVYAGWQALVPGDWVLLPARLLKALLAAALVLMLFRLLVRLGAGALLAAVLVLLLVHTGPLRGEVGLVRNYDLAQLSVLGGLLLLPLRPGDDERRWRLLGAGALAGIAVGFKLTYAAPALVVVAWPLIAPTTLSGGRRELAWTLTGALVGLAPLAGVLATTDPATLRFDLVDYHLLTVEWNRREGLGAGLDLAGKLRDARRLYRQTDLAALGLLTVTAAGLVAARGRGRSGTVWRLALWLIAAGVAMVVVPRPVHPAYYLPLLLAAVMLVAVAAVRLEGRPRLVLAALAGLACLVSVIHHGADDLRRLGGLGRTETWPAVRIHEAGRVLADLTARHPDRPVVTTHPLYALEAGRPLAPRFATGVFAWRLGNLLDRATERRCRLVTPRSLDDLMAREPAAAVVSMETGPWDEPLDAWSRAAGWWRAPLAAGVTAWLPSPP